MKSLSSDEQDMLLYVCNVIFPIRPPTPSGSEPYPVTLTMVRATEKNSILERIKQAEPQIKDEGRLVYEGLREKLGIPVEKKVVSEKTEVTGSA